MGMVVPITPSSAVQPRSATPPDPTMLAIAAATMHEQGRLFEPPAPTPEVVNGAK